ncbi:RND superfamily putative drug exporter [Kibdelosporangium banguiense]|uniref:RND superfamily putative drug exporter n=1 Tax=Kibdelosporangium banguiense TaxID=1365924 RepID=A0ABS4TLZ8_9PSEU|nr:MMPL family transporter [Kibdelosporangium banguiense]MBP2325416.1 RND superfamily putative drug exporter [Kibdelosporangium banguiense]
MNTQTLSRFERLAGWSRRHRWLAVILWVVTLAGITLASQAIGSDYHNDNDLPGTQSQQVADLLPDGTGDTVQVVAEGDLGKFPAVLDKIRSLPHVAAIEEPTVSGQIAFATVTLDAKGVPGEDVRRIIDTAKSTDLRVELGGDPVRAAEESDGGGAEGAGMLAALVILVLMFGSLLAAGLPLITAVFAVGSTVGIIMLASHLVDLPDYAPPVMILVGLGVGVDYALLIFARYRSELLWGADRDQAATRALDTAGRSVLFAGCTVIIALLGLLALGLGSLQGVALAVTLTVLLTLVASLTLLPALLSLLGKRIERAVMRRAHRQDGNRWRAWASMVQRRPWPALVLAVAALAALSLPALGMRLGFADAGTEAPTATSRQAYDLLAKGFGPGFNGPLVVVAKGGEQPALVETLTRTPGVARVLPPHQLPDASLVLLYPTTAPQDVATHDLVNRLRNDVLPKLPGTYLVGGATAAADDFAEAVSDRLPLFILVVVGLSALLLMVVFRSILVPLKAAVLNLLSIGAALGVVTMVFGDGAFGVQPGPIEAFVPVMIFAIVFGLSMDYEVFLLSRMHEEWRRTGDAELAVREGMASTGGVITAAAAIMIVVFGAFMLSPDRMLQQFGLGLAVAVLLDALVIRCLIVPAVMRLFGPAAWWLPRRIERRLPEVALEHA